MKGSQLKKYDLLIAIVGATIGKIGVYIYDKAANINQAIFGIRLKEHISPFYIQAFYQTNIGQKIIERAKRPVARANLNLEEIDEVVTPTFVKEIIEVVRDIHNEGIIKNKFGRELPILIHELEYYDEIANQNLEANGQYLPEGFIEFCMG